MKLSHRFSSLLLGAMTLALASILVFLYIRSSADNTSNYIASRDLIGQIKQQDARWETEILKARVSVSQNYDLLVEPLTKINTLWRQFDTIQSGHVLHADALWQDSRTAYLAAVDEKTRLVEKFKSHNAVLRNSLAFLPIAEDDIQKQFGTLNRSDPVLQAASMDIYDLLLGSLEFSQIKIGRAHV